MSAVAAPPLTVVLIGNPNTGKSTLFNALSGFRALTGNFPGVTVEKKIGKTRCGDRTVDLVDLPGTYSLSPRTLDEMVAVNVLLARQPQIDVPAVSGCSVAASRGIQIDAVALSERLGLPVVLTEAHRARGIDELRQVIAAAPSTECPARPRIFPPPFAAECEKLEGKLQELGQTATPYYLLERLLLDVGGYLESHTLNGRAGELSAYLAEARARLAEQGCKVPAIEARVRYAWAREVLPGVVRAPTSRPRTFGDRLDT